MRRKSPSENISYCQNYILYYNFSIQQIYWMSKRPKSKIKIVSEGGYPLSYTGGLRKSSLYFQQEERSFLNELLEKQKFSKNRRNSFEIIEIILKQQKLDNLRSYFSKEQLQQLIYQISKNEKFKHLSKQNSKQQKKQSQNTEINSTKRNYFQQVIQFFNGPNQLDEKKLMKQIKLLVSLMSSCYQKQNQRVRNWCKIPFESRLKQFQNFLESCPISTFFFNSLKKISKECSLIFYMNLRIQIQSKIQQKSGVSIYLQLLQSISQRLKQKIDQLQSRKQFIQKLNLYDNCELLVEKKALKDVQKMSFEQFEAQMNQQISKNTVILYLKTLIVKIKFFFQHQVVQKEINSFNIVQSLRKITHYEIKDLIIFRKNQNNIFDLCDSEYISREKQLKLYIKQFFNIQFKGSKVRAEISTDIPICELKSLIIYNLANILKVELNKQNMRLSFQFEKKIYRLIEDFEQINKLKKQFGDLKSLKVQLMTIVNLNYLGEKHIFKHWQNEPILNLKLQIKQLLKIPTESQIIQYESDTQLFRLESKQTLEQKKIQDQNIQLFLVLKKSLQFYGFHKNVPLKYDKFKQFFFEKNETRNNYLSTCNLRQTQEEAFFEKVICYIFSSLKKRLDLQSIIKLFRIQVSNFTKQEIWASTKQANTFNPTFILYYILYNSEPKLRVQIMNLVKHAMPLPLYFRDFSSIISIQNTWKINEQLIWILKDEFNIVSLGLHTSQNRKTEKGKSELLNKIFYTNFSKSQCKHDIALGCPEISLRVYENYYPANLIDIASQTPQQISNQILCKANFVILHSWSSQQETKKQIERIKSLCKKNTPVIIIYRDQSIQNRDNWIIKQQDMIDNKIEAFDISSKIDSIKIEILINSIKNLLHKQIHSTILSNPKIIPLLQTKNQKIKQFQKKLIKSKSIMTNFKDVSSVYKQFQQKYQQHNQFENQVKQNTQKFRLNPLIEELLNFISANMSQAYFLIERMKQKFKQFKDEIQQKYNILIHAKKDLDKIEEQSQQYQKKLLQYTKTIFTLPGIDKFQTQSRASVLQGLRKAIQKYNENIKPEILSMELFWREAYLLLQINPNYSLRNQLLINFVIELQRMQVYNNQPFEILDGDSLRMPKSIIKKIFESVKGTAATITILGPQSSGKSTLLNYLFGCDFKTSQGRCTRGVYGTYYNIANNSLFSCQSIFLIDTEGLLAMMSNRDKKIRENFDSKLILFCLTVSDFVIVNTKSDLDNKTMASLQICKQRLPKISQDPTPQFWLVMNQSQSSDITYKANDVNQLQSLFDLGNSRCLSQAFQTVVLSKDQISILQHQHDVIVKKKSKPDFEKSTSKLQFDIMEKITKKKCKSIFEIVNKMDLSWQTIQNFPDLGKSQSEEVRTIDTEIDKWKEENIEKLNRLRDILLQQFSQNKKKQQEILSQFEASRQQISKQFQKIILNKNVSLQINQKIKSKRALINIEFEQQSLKLKYGIQDIEMKKKIRIEQLEGNIDIKNQIKKIKQQQSQKKCQIPYKEKVQRFQKVFQNTVDKLKDAINEEQQIKNYFQRVKQYYSSHIKQRYSSSEDSLQRVILPQFSQKSGVFTTYEESKNLLLKEFQRQQYGIVIQHSKLPHTNVLIGGKMDATLKYFDMNDYFQKHEKKCYLIIPKNKLFQSIKMNSLQKNILDQFSKEKQKHKKNPIQNISKEINLCLAYYGLQFSNLNSLVNTLQNILQEKTKGWPFVILIKNIFNFGNNPPQLTRIQSNGHNYINSKYFNSNLFQNKYQKQLKINKNSILKNISQGLFQHIIRMDEIQKQINNSKENIQQKQKIIIEYSGKIQQQFLSIGVLYDARELIRDILNGKIQQYSFKYQNFQSASIQVKSVRQFQKKLELLIQVNGNHILKHFQQNTHVGNFDKNNIVMATLNKQILEPKEQNNKYKIGRYLDQKSREVMNYLKTQQIKQFLWQQLKSKKIFQKLFVEFDRIIQTACSKGTSLTNSVQEIFSNVVRQIRTFNDDIGQVSHKLSFYFQGFCHRYIIQMTSKKFSTFKQNILAQPVDQWMQQKQSQFKYFINMTYNH